MELSPERSEDYHMDLAHYRLHSATMFVDDTDIVIPYYAFNEKVFVVDKCLKGAWNNHEFQFYGVTLVANMRQTASDLLNAFGAFLSHLPTHVYLHDIRFELTKAKKLHIHTTIECGPILYYKDIPCVHGYSRCILKLIGETNIKKWMGYSNKSTKSNFWMPTGELLLTYRAQNEYLFRPRANTQVPKMNGK